LLVILQFRNLDLGRD